MTGETGNVEGIGSRFMYTQNEVTSISQGEQIEGQANTTYQKATLDSLCCSRGEKQGPQCQ